MEWLRSFGRFLETLDQERDLLLAPFIRRFWPRAITPNLLTVLRIAVAAALFVLLFGLGISRSAVIMPLFGTGALTDLFDGSVARILNMKTAWGAVADPVADRLLIIPIAVYSLASFQLTLLALLILFETINALLSLRERKLIPNATSNIFGKTKMLLQSVAFVAILFFWPREPHAFFVTLIWISLGFLMMSIVFKILEIRHAGKTVNL